MAEDTIRRIFFAPSVAIARLGGSDSPMEAYDWAPGDPHTIGDTRIRPAWSLQVDVNGSVTAWLPKEIRIRDGALHRPVAPFLELWALTGDGKPGDWRPQPLTQTLLRGNGRSEAQLTFTVTAMNLKAARRCRDERVRFGTFPPVSVRADQHLAVPLQGQSPPGIDEPLIPPGRVVELGAIQVLRPQPQPDATVVPADVRLDVIRLRYTPARGLFYGPPQAASTELSDGPAVPPQRAFLNPDAGWFHARYQRDDGTIQTSIVNPLDTYDMIGATGISLGVIDDTCELIIVADIGFPQPVGPLQAHANVMVGPPHFAPDRRPFLSLADEINDRERAPGGDDDITDAELDGWVEDLFERAYETASLLDLDFWRERRAAEVPKAQQRPQKQPEDDGVPRPDYAMGGKDPLRDPAIRILKPLPAQLFPLSERAGERHRTLSDISQLRSFVLQHPGRLAELIRRPFTVANNEGPGVTTMQMPPFMRNSNAFPLALSHRQYRLLMRWEQRVAEQHRAEGVAAAAGPAPLSLAAATRRQQVLDLIARARP